MRMVTIASVAEALRVVLKKIWMNGYPVGVERMLETSPRVKHRVTTITKPRTPLTATPDMMALGNVSDAFLISSAVPPGVHQHPFP